MAYTYDSVLRRYRYANGRLITPSEFDAILTRVREEAIARSDQLIADRLDSKLTIQQWLDAFAEDLKTTHEQMFLLGIGGQDRMTAADIQVLSDRVADQLGFLESFAGDIEAGSQSEAQQRARARLYVRAAMHSRSIAMRRSTGAGDNQERRILNGTNHCDSCERYARRGWQPIGSLPDIGSDCECGSSCQCSFEFRVGLIRPQRRP